MQDIHATSLVVLYVIQQTIQTASLAFQPLPPMVLNNVFQIHAILQTATYVSKTISVQFVFQVITFQQT